MNGDGISDLLVGSSTRDGFSGGVYIMYMSPGNNSDPILNYTLITRANGFTALLIPNA